MDITSYLLGKKSSSGGGDLSEYFNDSVTVASSQYNSFLMQLIKKIPSFTISSNITNGIYGFSTFKGNEIPAIDTSNIKDFSLMFNRCTNITTIPQLDTSKGTKFTSMFYYCTSLKTIPQLDTSKGVECSNMFSSCNNLIAVPQLDMSSATNISDMFYGTSNNLVNLGGFKDLGKAYLTTVSANYSNYQLYLSRNNNLTHDSLMNVINNLYDIASAGVQQQKLTLGSTNLAKLTEDEIAIATNKGWAVS